MEALNENQETALQKLQPKEVALKRKNDLALTIQQANDRKFSSSLTIQSAVSGTAIGSFRNDQECQKMIYEHVFVAVFKISQMYNVGNAMNDSQVADTVDALMDKCLDWSIEDFAIWPKTVLARNANGIPYPEVFGRLDPITIVALADTYNEAKAEAREKAKEKEKSERILADRKAIAEADPEQFPSLVPFIEKFEELKKDRKSEIHGTGNAEALRQKFSTEEKPVESADPYSDMKFEFDRILFHEGRHNAELSLAAYIKANGENAFTDYALDRLEGKI